MPVYLRKNLNPPIWYYRFQVNGRRFHGSTRCTKKTDAEAFERRERVQAQEKADRPRDSLDMIAGRWWHEVGEPSRDAEAVAIRLKRLIERLGAHTAIDSISFDTLSEFTAARRREPTIHGRLPAAATVNREIQLLRRVLRRAEKWGYSVQRIDWTALLAAEPPEHIAELSSEDEARIAEALPEEWRGFFAFLIVTGWRVSAAADLRWTEIRTDVIEREGKGGARIRAMRTASVDTILDGQRGLHSSNVFGIRAVRTTATTVRGEARPLTRHMAIRAWHLACDKAGVPRCRVHDLRHTAGTRIVRETGNLKIAQKLLGHSRITTTTRYAHVFDDELRAAMERTSARTTEEKKIATNMKLKRNCN